jgi:hypothetical protein
MADIGHHIACICGWFIYLPFHILNVHATFPDDAKYKSCHHNDLGILGLLFMHLAFHADYIPDSAGVIEICDSTLCEKRSSVMLNNCLLLRDGRRSDVEIYLGSESMEKDYLWIYQGR